ncbi:MAG: YraN family protein [Chloroflexi bacterium]|nr:YraN family protein [Chloroflexota bacterium]
MSSKRQLLGRWGEELAVKFLTQKGYEIIEQNMRNEYGEIDLISKHGDVLVFVEVKTRATKSFGFPEESVTAAKQAHLIDAAQAYLQANTELDTDWRIDVIAIQRGTGKQAPKITHFENAVS